MPWRGSGNDALSIVSAQAVGVSIDLTKSGQQEYRQWRRGTTSAVVPARATFLRWQRKPADPAVAAIPVLRGQGAGGVTAGMTVNDGDGDASAASNGGAGASASATSITTPRNM
jgi:hypothetical protein